MRSETIHSIVLTGIDYGETDRIVSLFTLEHGRVKAFARGARSSRRRFGPALEPFARIEVQARLKEGLSTLQQADIVSIYPAVRADLERIGHALYACELIDAITPEGLPLPRLFRLFACYLDRLEQEGASGAERRFFEINLLNILGYRPPLEACGSCGAPFDSGGAWLRGGEPVCRSCQAGDRHISALCLRVLASCLKTGIFGQVPFPAETLDEAGRLIDDAIAHHAGRRLKSLEFLARVTSAPAAPPSGPASNTPQ